MKFAVIILVLLVAASCLPGVSFAQNQAIPFDMGSLTSADAIRPVRAVLSPHIVAIIENGNVDTSGNLTTYHRATTGTNWQWQGILPAPGIARCIDVNGCFMAVGKTGQVDVWWLSDCATSDKPTWFRLHQVAFTNSSYTARDVALDYNEALGTLRFAALVDRPSLDLNPPGAAVYVYEFAATSFVQRAELTMMFTNEFAFASSRVAAMALRGERIVLAAPDDRRIALHARNQGGSNAWGLVTAFTGSTQVASMGYSLAIDGTRIASSERLAGGGSRIAVYTNTLPAGNAWNHAGILLDQPPGEEFLSVSLENGRLATLGLPGGLTGFTTPTPARWRIYGPGVGPGGWALQRQGQTGPHRVLAVIGPILGYELPRPSLAGDRLALGFGGTNTLGRLTGRAVSIHRADAGGANQWGVERIIQDSGTPLGFGDSVAMAMTTMVSGMPRDNAMGTNTGSAYVWTLVDDNNFRGWIPTAKLMDRQPEQDFRFGEAVALTPRENAFQNLIAVGSPGSLANKGAVTTFKTFGFLGQTEPGRWLEPPLHTNNSRFGAALAMYGDWMAIGAPDHPAGGAVYMARFTGSFSTGTWAIVRTNFPPSSGVGYGAKVALDGRNLAISRPFTNAEGRRVFMHRKDTGGTNAWGLSQTLLPPTNSPAGFGESVALFPTTAAFSLLAVGATGSGSQTGAVFVYVISSATTNQWTLLTRVDGGGDGPSFGASVAFSDMGLLSVGAPGAGAGGRVRLYSVLGWPDPSTNGVLLATRNGATGERLGTSIAAGFFYTVAGAPLNATNGPQAGALHSFRIGSYEYWAGQQPAGFASAWQPHQDWDGDGHQNLAEFAAAANPMTVDTQPLFTMHRATQGGQTYMAWTRPTTPHDTFGLEQNITVSTDLRSWWTPSFITSITNSRTRLFSTSPVFHHHRLELRYPVFDMSLGDDDDPILVLGQ